MKDTKFEDFLVQQEKLTEDLQKFVNDLDVDTLISDKESLTQQVANLQNELAQTKMVLQQKEQEKQEYKLSFHELLLDEKKGRLRKNQARLNRLIAENQTEQSMTLANLETTIRQDINNLNQTILTNKITLATDAETKINNLINKLLQQVEQQKQLVNETSESLKKQNDSWHETNLATPISEATILEEKQRVKTETRLGLKAFNYLGIFFIFLAVITLGLLTVNYLSDTVKGLLLFIIPTLFFGGGEILRRRDKKTFAFGLIGGSIGLYYIAIYINYFILGVFTSGIAFATLIIISILAIILARFYKNLAIAILALVGGYLPIISYWQISGFDSTSLYFAQSYVLILNVFMIYLYRKFNWKSLNIISFVLMTPWIYLFTNLGLHNQWIDYGFGIIYLGLFAGIPLYEMFKSAKEVTNYQQITILGSLISFSGLGYMMLQANAHIQNIIVLCFYLILYIGTMYVLRKSNDAKLSWGSVVAFIFSVIYLLLITTIYIPFIWIDNYRLAYISLTLLSAGYLYFAKTYKSIQYFVAAIIHYVLLYLSLFIGNVFGSIPFWINTVVMIGFALQYFYLATQKQTLKPYLRSFYNGLNIVMFIHINAYLLTMTQAIFTNFENNFSGNLKSWIDFIVLIIFNFVAIKITDMKKYYLPFIGMIILVLLGTSQNFRILPVGLGIIEVIIPLIGNGLLSFLLLKHLQEYVKKEKLSVSFAMIIMTVFLLINGRNLLVYNLDFAYLTILLDIIYGTVALIYVIIGLRKSLPIIRRVGLGLMLATMAKLLLLDIPTVTLFSKMIAFFAFGGLSLLISYIYQNALNKTKKLLENEQDTNQIN